MCSLSWVRAIYIGADPTTAREQAFRLLRLPKLPNPPETPEGKTSCGFQVVRLYLKLHEGADLSPTLLISKLLAQRPE